MWAKPLQLSINGCRCPVRSWRVVAARAGVRVRVPFVQSHVSHIQYNIPTTSMQITPPPLPRNADVKMARLALNSARCRKCLVSKCYYTGDVIIVLRVAFQVSNFGQVTLRGWADHETIDKTRFLWYVGGKINGTSIWHNGESSAGEFTLR